MNMVNVYVSNVQVEKSYMHVNNKNYPLHKGVVIEQSGGR